jgi:hypothetical protein
MHEGSCSFCNNIVFLFIIENMQIMSFRKLLLWIFLKILISLLVVAMFGLSQMHDTSQYWGLVTLSLDFCSSCEFFYLMIWDNVCVPWSYDLEPWSGVVQFLVEWHLFCPLHPRLPWCSCWLSWWLKRTYYCVFFWLLCF